MSAPSGRMLSPSPHHHWIGLDLGGTKCAVSQWDGDRVVETMRVPTREFADTFAELASGIQSLRANDARPVRLGISCGGPLDRPQGVITCPPNLPASWHGQAICERLISTFGGEATLMNDANACALAEWAFGAGRGTRHFVFCTSGTGFGAGLILNGRLYEGATGDAGEIGHVRLAPKGPVGFGQAGSVEGFCSGGGIARLAEMRRSDHPDLPASWRDETLPITAQRLAEAAHAGDPFARRIWTEAGQRLGQTLAIMIDLLNPECIALGGFFPKASRLLAEGMHSTLSTEALETPRAACRIVPAELGDTIGSHGAIAAAVNTFQS